MERSLIIIYIVAHLILFNAMFIIKNAVLSKKLKISIRGKNKEAVVSVLLITITITAALLSLFIIDLHNSLYPISFFASRVFVFIGLCLLPVSLLISLMALINMKESWRVGIKTEERTELITSGIFGFTRNPYFLSYILLFIAYIFLIPNIVVLILSVLTIISIHIMILAEEAYLAAVHGNDYLQYKKRVARYLVL